jgi:hypothetical protein
MLSIVLEEMSMCWYSWGVIGLLDWKYLKMHRACFCPTHRQEQLRTIFLTGMEHATPLLQYSYVLRHASYAKQFNFHPSRWAQEKVPKRIPRNHESQKTIFSMCWSKVFTLKGVQGFSHFSSFNFPRFPRFPHPIQLSRIFRSAGALNRSILLRQTVTGHDVATKVPILRALALRWSLGDQQIMA